MHFDRHKHGFCFLAVISAWSCSAQETVTVSGTVTDAANNRPLPNVNVYFNNTTLGSSTDTLGQFAIYKVPVASMALVISSIGYKTLKVANLELSPGKNTSLDIKIVPVAGMLAPITILARRPRGEWTNKYKLFREILFGSTDNAFETKIINPEVLSFENLEGNPGSKNFTAQALGPLEIENHALGYRMTVSLEEFTSLDNSYKILISTRFDTLLTQNSLEQARWKHNRVTTFKGSQRHLFKSIATGRHQEEGFRIFKGITVAGSSAKQGYDYNKLPDKPGIQLFDNNPASLTDIILDTTESDPKILRKGVYQIHYVHKTLAWNKRNLTRYPFPVSWIEVVDQYLSLYPNGEVKLPANFWRSGYLEGLRLADLLPSNFDIVTEEAHLALSRSREFVAIHGIVKDENDHPLSGVEVFVNNGLSNTTTNVWGQFELADLYPGKYPVAFTFGGKKQVLQTIDVSPENDSEVAVQLQQQKSSQPIVMDKDWEAHEKIFESLLFQNSSLNFRITNPYVLQFIKRKKLIEVRATAPLYIESPLLGYRWKYFTDTGFIVKNRLNLSGLVKMEELPASNDSQQDRWRTNQLNEYQGSWNHFISSLFNGRAPADGFLVYQVKKGFDRKRPRFKNLNDDAIAPVHPDSILFADNGRLFLNVLPGIEVHNANRRPTQKYYKGLPKQVIRFTSDSAFVNCSRNGMVDPGDITISGLQHPFLPRVPADYRPPSEKITNPDVLLFVTNQNLRAVKDLLEKVYVQTDKPYYYVGDTIWLKAYLKYSNLKFRDSLSRVLYADFLSPQGNVITTAILKIADAQAWGDLLVGQDISPGDYFLRVYTNWMRNFDEFYIQPLPILSRESFIESEPIDTASTRSDDLEISVSQDQPQYGTRTPVTLKLEVWKDGQPLDVSFSVSVTDQSAVSELSGLPKIKSLEKPFHADGAKMIRIKYPIEKGITLNGKILKGKKEDVYRVATLLMNDDTKLLTFVRGDDFLVTLDFADTTTALLQCFDKKETPFDIDIPERAPVQSYQSTGPLRYQIVENKSYTRHITQLREEVRVLQEVIIRAKRISQAQKTNLTFTQRSFGQPTKLYQGKALESVRTTGNLATFLLTHLPDFQKTLCEITYLNQTMPGSVSPCFQDRIHSIYSFYLDGLPVELSNFHTLPSYSVSRVEVYTMPSSLKGIDPANIIAIYTDPFVPFSTQNFERYRVRGYDIPNTFGTAAAKSNTPDYRSTLYWNPQVKTGTDGTATFSFRTSDVDGKYKVTIEGMTNEGSFFRLTKYIHITK